MHFRVESALKKRSKKLLHICACGPVRCIRMGAAAPTDKSLFASFSSEKEDSSCLSPSPLPSEA
jgi:hypothetical protein